MRNLVSLDASVPRRRAGAQAAHQGTQDRRGRFASVTCPSQRLPNVDAASPAAASPRTEGANSVRAHQARVIAGPEERGAHADGDRCRRDVAGACRPDVLAPGGGTLSRGSPRPCENPRWRTLVERLGADHTLFPDAPSLKLKVSMANVTFGNNLSFPVPQSTQPAMLLSMKKRRHMPAPIAPRISWALHGGSRS